MSLKLLTCSIHHIPGFAESKSAIRYAIYVYINTNTIQLESEERKIKKIERYNPPL